MTYFINAMYGTTGITIATVSVMGVGLLCLAHVLDWKWLLYAIGASTMVFGAGAIVDGVKSLVTNM